MDQLRWETSTDPRWMLRAWGTRLGPPLVGAADRADRKLYLFAAAAGRQLQWLYRHDWHRLAHDAAEEIADAPGLEDVIRRAVRDLYEDVGRPTHPDNPNLDLAACAFALPHEMWEGIDGAVGYAAAALRTAWGNRVPPGPSHADLLRDIIGNPFQPVKFDPSWRTSTAVALARGMYESRDFAHMPILADALQDAGCEDAAVIGHCRDPLGVHVRGCWVVDLVLNKS